MVPASGPAEFLPLPPVMDCDWDTQANKPSPQAISGHVFITATES